MAEYTTKNEDMCDMSLTAYKEAMDIGKDKLHPTHPVWLGLMLNFSVFFYEILGEKSMAITLGNEAFEDAIQLIENTSDENHKDTTLLIQLLMDNLTAWTSECEDELKQEAIKQATSLEAYSATSNKDIAQTRKPS